MKSVSLVASLVAMVAIADGQDTTPDLDLTTIARPSDSDVQRPAVDGIVVGQSGRVGGGFVTHQAARPLPITMRLLRIDPESCHWSDSISYDVEVKNVGTTNLLLPWSVDPRDAGEATGARDAFAMLSLTLFVADDTRDGFSGTETLYGTKHNTLTTRSIPPGRTVIIRAGARCELLAEGNARLVAARRAMSFEVAAEMRVLQSPGDVGEAVTTTSTRRVTITRP